MQLKLLRGSYIPYIYINRTVCICLYEVNRPCFVVCVRALPMKCHWLSEISVPYRHGLLIFQAYSLAKLTLIRLSVMRIA